MSNPDEIKKQELIKEYLEISGRWNGSDDGYEEKINDLAGELEDMGVNVDEL